MKKLFSLVFVLLLVFSCKEEVLIELPNLGDGGGSFLLTVDVLAPTNDHLNGGWVLKGGEDLNGNGVLDTDEVKAELPLWHGNDGINGTNGTNGLNGANGTVVTISEDGYWVLDGTVTEFKALGVDGTNGTNGNDGHSPYIGEDGYWYVWDVDLQIFISTNIKAEGQDGVDGQTPNIVFLTQDVEPTLGHYNGGILVTAVWDKNNDQQIDQNEIIGAYTVWHGNDGADGLTPYIGEDGYWWIGEYFTGVKAIGIDGTNGTNGTNGENGFSPYVDEDGYWVFWFEGGEYHSDIPATGPQGPRGYQGEQGERGTIVGYTVTTAQNCDTNGYRVTMTIDEGLPSEYQTWFEVCDGKVGANGENGYNSLINLVEDEETGCVEVQVGLDVDRSSTLDEEEITGRKTICNGENGANGENGLNSLIKVVQYDGYVLIASGLDVNGNGQLERSEVTSYAYVYDGTDGINGTNGTNGKNSLIEVYESSEDCVTIVWGVDDNENGTLDEGEIDGDEQLCGCSVDCGGDCDDNEEEDPCTPNSFGKVKVCHQQTIGNTTKYFTIYVNENALQGHLDHGDNCGACE